MGSSRPLIQWNVSYFMHLGGARPHCERKVSCQRRQRNEQPRSQGLFPGFPNQGKDPGNEVAQLIRPGLEYNAAQLIPIAQPVFNYGFWICRKKLKQLLY